MSSVTLYISIQLWTKQLSEWVVTSAWCPSFQEIYSCFPGSPHQGPYDPVEESDMIQGFDRVSTVAKRVKGQFCYTTWQLTPAPSEWECLTCITIAIPCSGSAHKYMETKSVFAQIQHEGVQKVTNERGDTVLKKRGYCTSTAQPIQSGTDWSTRGCASIKVAHKSIQTANNYGIRRLKGSRIRILMQALSPEYSDTPTGTYSRFKQNGQPISSMYIVATALKVSPRAIIRKLTLTKVHTLKYKEVKVRDFALCLSYSWLN